jgi:hypothetical protein
MAERLDIGSDEAAELVRLVVAFLADFVSVREVADIVEQLPDGMKRWLPEGSDSEPG